MRGSGPARSDRGGVRHAGAPRRVPAEAEVPGYVAAWRPRMSDDLSACRCGGTPCRTRCALPSARPCRATRPRMSRSWAAGYTGLWTAYYLARDPTLRIAILDARARPASGPAAATAAGRPPSSLPAWRPLPAIVPERGLRMQRAMYATVDEIGRVAATEGWDIHWAKGGTVVAARTPLQLDAGAARRSPTCGPGASATGRLRLLDQAEAVARLGCDRCPGRHVHAALRGDPSRASRPQPGRTVVVRGRPPRAHARWRRSSPASSEPRRGTVRAEIVVRATEGYTRTLRGQTRTLARSTR